MTAWSSGYVADIGYLHGYYTELNPLRSKLALLYNRYVSPSFEAACELGFGQGVSVNFHAAATATRWYGNDFNPAQAGFAQELSRASDAGACLSDEAFTEFCTRADLPDFDFIGLHGIWSWISDSNRHLLVDFIRRKLKVGGVLYISYNTLPGWAAFVPMRHLMALHSQTESAIGRGIVPSINDALAFAEKLLATNPAYSRVNPSVPERMGKLKEQNSNYLAHEYFNRDWNPMHFATMKEWLEPAKVQYACSAHFTDYFDAVNLTADQQKLLTEIPDPMFRESVRDFMTNQQFRRDYWVKGARKMTALERHEALIQTSVMLIEPRADIPLVIKGALGEGKMDQSVYGPILDVLADHKTRSIGQIAEMTKKQGVGLTETTEAIMILVAANHVAPVQDDAGINTAKAKTEKLNRYIQQKCRSTNDFSQLVSPVTGGGININRFQQLFLLAFQEGKAGPDEWAVHAWETLSRLGEKLLINGKALDTNDENLAELIRQARTFSETKMPLVKALQIV